MVGRNLIAHASAGQYDILSPDRKALDLTDYAQVEDYLSREKPDIVIHLAGRVGGIQANIREPVAFLADNLDIGRNLVLAAHSVGVERLINLGSSCMYPREASNPLRESMILTGTLEPTNEGYALAKIVVSRLCMYVNQQYPNRHYKTLIPCNVYGYFDKFDPAHSHLVPALIHKIHCAVQNGDKTVEIWGSGEARREFLFASDLADCIWRAVSHFDTLPELMNVGLGTDYTINEYYAAVAEVVGFSGLFSHDLDRPVGMMQKLVDSSVATDWGWQSKTPLKDGVRQTYEHYLKEQMT